MPQEHKHYYTDAIKTRSKVEVFLAILIIGLILFVMVLSFEIVKLPTELADYIVITSVVILVGIPIVHFLIWRCPNCNQYLGTDFNPDFCPNCLVNFR